jgi:hypothetical protein
MPGLVPGIHVFVSVREKNAGGRDKPGHDDVENIFGPLSVRRDPVRPWIASPVTMTSPGQR